MGLDYVLMHEMSHLLHPDHSKEFWEKVSEYNILRGQGFLIAKGMEKDELKLIASSNFIKKIYCIRSVIHYYGKSTCFDG